MRKVQTTGLRQQLKYSSDLQMHKMLMQSRRSDSFTVDFEKGRALLQ